MWLSLAAIIVLGCSSAQTDTAVYSTKTTVADRGGRNEVGAGV